jgi:hypothetical protein
MNFSRYIYILFFFLLSSSGFAQINSIKYKVETITSISSNDNLPFWLVNNRNGLIPDKRSDLLYIGFNKDYSTSKKSIALDYSFGFDAATSYQYDKKALINQYFASVKYGKIQLFVGAKNTDVLYDGLSFVNNSIIMAGNARNYPKIEISSTDYLNVPFTKGWLAVKGKFSNGWLIDDRYCSEVMLHHKNAYLRIGKEKGFSFELGVEHYAQWGGISPMLEGVKNRKMPSNLDAFLRVLIAKEGGTYYNDMENSLGNHVGQNEIKFNYNTDNFDATFYMRNMFEDSSQYFLKLFYKSIRDIKDINYGLYVKIHNTKIIKSFLVEYYSTMMQGNTGSHSSGTLVGYDSNFNNSIYASGWSNYGRGFGIPLNSPTNISADNRIHFGNTAFRAFNIGVNGEFKNIRYKFKATYDFNYGSVHDRNEGKKAEEWMSEDRWYTIDPAQFQQHYLLELMMPEGKLPFDISTIFALDNGDMYDDNFGMMIKISKTGFLNKLFKR